MKRSTISARARHEPKFADLRHFCALRDIADELYLKELSSSSEPQGAHESQTRR